MHFRVRKRVTVRRQKRIFAALPDYINKPVKFRIEA
jgi:hypothetical protein